MRGLWFVGVFSMIVVALLGTSGCGPSVSREELGEVVFELPKVPAGEQHGAGDHKHGAEPHHSHP